jgi:hypothetical protein
MPTYVLNLHLTSSSPSSLVIDPSLLNRLLSRRWIVTGTLMSRPLETSVTSGYMTGTYVSLKSNVGRWRSN